MRIVDIRRHPIRNSQLIFAWQEAPPHRSVRTVAGVQRWCPSFTPSTDMPSTLSRGVEVSGAMRFWTGVTSVEARLTYQVLFFGRCGATFRISSSVTNVPRISRAACGLLSKVASLSGDSFLPVSQNSKASRSPCCKCRVEVLNGVNRIEHPPNWRCCHNCSPAALPRNLPRRRERHFVLAAWTGRQPRGNPHDAGLVHRRDLLP